MLNLTSWQPCLDADEQLTEPYCADPMPMPPEIKAPEPATPPPAAQQPAADEAAAGPAVREQIPELRVCRTARWMTALLPKPRTGSGS